MSKTRNNATPYSIILILVTSLVSACSNSNNGPSSTNVGNIGPGGGIVFALFDDNIDNISGLEVTQASIGEAAWGCEGVVVDAGIGDRPSNGIGVPVGFETSEIIREANSTGICLAEAAQLTFEFMQNGRQDWFLPSTDELLLIRDLDLLAGGEGDAFWSSTEDTAQNAFAVLIRSLANDFDNGEPSTNSKTTVANVVAIRRF